MNEGLIKSKFVNLKIRKLSAETSHDFIEWCGLISETEQNEKLEINVKLNKQQLYFDFIEEYPDYGPKSKMTISRTRFYKWLSAYALFKTGVAPIEGRDSEGRWLTIVNKHAYENQSSLSL